MGESKRGVLGGMEMVGWVERKCFCQVLAQLMMYRRVLGLGVEMDRGGGVALADDGLGGII